MFLLVELQGGSGLQVFNLKAQARQACGRIDVIVVLLSVCLLTVALLNQIDHTLSSLWPWARHILYKPQSYDLYNGASDACLPYTADHSWMDK